MAQYVIGDIHGCFSALQCLLTGLSVTDEDRFITLGDYVDRGPDTRAVLDWLIEQHAESRVIPIRGNHEELMLNARLNHLAFEGWLMSGGRQTLKSFNLPLRQASLLDIPDRYWKFIEEDCKPYHETEKFIFVHANLDATLEMHEQDPHILMWRRFMKPIDHMSGKLTLCGHTAQSAGVPKFAGNGLCIDTWVYGDGWLTALDLDAFTFWQANEQQQFRKGWIHDSKVWVYPRVRSLSELDNTLAPSES